MCGIFGWALNSELGIRVALEILKRLEVFTYPGRASPVGGHGAGISYLKENRDLFLAKVGKTNGSPVSDLLKTMDYSAVQTKVLLEHVRRASPQFNETVKWSECTQPYRGKCIDGVDVVSVHNGFLSNYKALKDSLSASHHYESERIELIDSELFPHACEELVKTHGLQSAAEKLLCKAEGNATVGLLTRSGEDYGLDILHRGRTVGLNIWKNPDREVVFCSRWEPVEELMGEWLRERGFQRKVYIEYGEPAIVAMSFNPLKI